MDLLTRSRSGELQLWVNGVCMIHAKGLILREGEASHIKGMYFQTFFGGEKGIVRNKIWVLNDFQGTRLTGHPQRARVLGLQMSLASLLDEESLCKSYIQQTVTTMCIDGLGVNYS
ncbi:hypothetical protein HYDPIDRAFT_112872, partial [Hydnomerulius pinastri MD-312]